MNWDLIKHIEISLQLQKELENAVFLRPQVDFDNNVVTIKINTTSFLKYASIHELKQKTESYLSMKVNFIFNTDCEVNHDTLVDYIEYYNVLHKPTINVIPIINKGKIYLDLSNDNFTKLTAFLRDLGINNEFVLGRFDVVSIDDKKVSYSKTMNTDNNYRSTFTKKEDYLFITMNHLQLNNEKVFCTGKIITINRRENIKTARKTTMTIETIYISDFTDAIIVKRFITEKTDMKKLLTVYEGQVVNVYGILKFDDYDNCNIFDLQHIEEVQQDPFVLADDYQGEKHIDLHVHTNRSDMDGISETSELVKLAYNFNQKGLAITDNSVVQAYPLAQQTHIKLDKQYPNNDFKVIYGLDVKVVDDEFKIVYNPTNQNVYDSEFVVIDLETTGLSNRYDHIIEFGGIIVRNNIVTNERLQLFIKPPVSIPSFIANKTNITDEMVADANDFAGCIDQILDFIKDRVIVAHNADFDFNFLNENLIRIGRKPLTNICLDTLNLARIIVKNRKYYRLGVIANNYKVEYDEETAHRGDYDAEVLAKILVKMLQDIPNYHNVTFNELQSNQGNDTYKKQHTYSMTLLAKNMAGIKKIYEIVTLSHVKYLTYYAKEDAKKIDSDIQAEPRIVKSEILKRRGDLLIGSCNQNSELFEIAMNKSLDDLKECMKMYDYIEIQPLDNYRNLCETGSAVDEERIINVINDIIFLADQMNIPIIASSDVYYAHPYQKIAREVYIMAKRIGGLRHPSYPMNKEKRKNYQSVNQHLMPTQQLLDCFNFTNRAKEFVIDNPKKIYDMIEKMYPIPQELATPEIEGCESILTEVVYHNAYEKYGEPLPQIVKDRIEKELNNIIKNGYSVQYYIAYLLVKKSNEDGYPVGSRGSVGSSLVATLADITEVNPLPPHYVCPKCHHSEFFNNNEATNGFDLPEKECPECHTIMKSDGHNIPFETFLGFNGDKVPDIDLNFSPEYQGIAQAYVKEIFGEDYSYRAGTIGTVAEKTAYGYVKGYCEETDKPFFNKAYNTVLAKLSEGVKRTTGQHPGGIVVIPKTSEIHDFTPIQYPANNPFSDWLTTHYAFADLHDNILKLDILAHIDPSAIRLLSIFSGVDYHDVSFSDPKVLSLFYSTDALNLKASDKYHELNGAAGLPEFGTSNNRRILNKTKPCTFSELVNLEGLTHGEDLFARVAEPLIDQKVASLKDMISCRDDIMTYLIAMQLDAKTSFTIMESVRHGRGLKPEWEEEMKKHQVPDWYINACKMISYMFPKAHAAAYAMNAVRVGWYKVYKPAAYYAVYFSLRCDAYDIETMIKGEDSIYQRLTELQGRTAKRDALSKKEEDLIPMLEIALEMYLRGYSFSNISLKQSDAMNFTISPDDEKVIIPSFNCIDGLGSAVAQSIVEQRSIREFSSKEDLVKRTSINNTQLAFLERIGVLDNLSNEDQINLFGL